MTSLQQHRFAGPAARPQWSPPAPPPPRTPTSKCWQSVWKLATASGAAWIGGNPITSHKGPDRRTDERMMLGDAPVLRGLAGGTAIRCWLQQAARASPIELGHQQPERQAGRWLDESHRRHRPPPFVCECERARSQRGDGAGMFHALLWTAPLYQVEWSGMEWSGVGGAEWSGVESCSSFGSAA